MVCVGAMLALVGIFIGGHSIRRNRFGGMAVGVAVAIAGVVLAFIGQRGG